MTEAPTDGRTVGLIAVGGTYYLHAQTLTISVLVAGLQVGFLATVLIAINNLRDAPQDALVGKKTLAVRFGMNFARIEIFVLTVTPFAIGWYWYGQGNRYAHSLTPRGARPSPRGRARTARAGG